MRCLTLLAALAAVSASAQGVDDPSNRPISRGEVIVAVERQFTVMDLNRDGVVDAREFERYFAFQSRHPPTTNVAFTAIGRQWFNQANADAGGTGRITLAVAMRRPLKLFGLADTDGDGAVSIRERNAAAMRVSLGE